jgi:hypothetical protein
MIIEYRSQARLATQELRRQLHVERLAGAANAAGLKYWSDCGGVG